MGEGPPLTLLHLLFETREFWWRTGYVDALRRSGRQLILIDASGHGESSKPKQKEPYALRPRADEVAAVLDDLKIETTEVLRVFHGWVDRPRPGLPLPRSSEERRDRGHRAIRARFAAFA